MEVVWGRFVLNRTQIVKQSLNCRIHGRGNAFPLYTISDFCLVHAIIVIIICTATCHAWWTGTIDNIDIFGDKIWNRIFDPRGL